ncbi:mediator of DNA damage checkpoint protein 1 isoform 3-T8 [Hipposideros larvatus]
MEDTQAINWEAEEEEETERHSESLGCILEPLGRLRIFSSAHGPEKDFPLYLGKNVVGRMPDCSVVLPFPSISKQHAVIEISAWNKAPVLQDCGSLNGTKILRPPKVLSPGVSHHLRDQELVVFADLPCQYHRLDVPLPFVSRGRLTVEETPREQGRTQPQGLLLAEDSEEEVDPLSERCVVKEPRTTSSPMATVVPESDEEGPSPPPDGPRPPLAFNLDSDTDEEEIQQPAAREASSAATATEQPKAVITEIQLKKDQRSVKEGNNDIKVKRDARNGVILERSQPAGEDSDTDVDDESGPPGRTVEVHLERAQPSGSTDSDTDVEEEGVPATPAVVPVKKREIFYGVSTKSPGGAGLAHLQESPAGRDTDVEKGAAPLMVPQERNQPPIVIDSNTDDEEEVSAALALTCLKESHAAMWNRDTDVKEARAQPLALLERSHTSAGTDSDTDVEEEGFPVEKRESVPKGDTDKAHSEKSQPLFRDCDIEMEKDKSSSGVHLEKSQASATVGMNTQVEEEVPPGPAVTLWEKHQVPVAWTNPTNVETEGDPAELPGGQLEEAWHPPGTPGEPTQPQRKGTQLPTESGREPHVDMTRDSGDNCDVLKAGKSKIKAPADSVSDSEDLDLQATQCFAETENQSLEAVPSIEDEPTQAFVPQEPGPSHCSFRDPGALDEPWEILPTQPFCPRESETSETQPIAAQLEAHGSCPSPLRAMPRDQHPESPDHTEPLRIQGRGRQTVKKGMGIPSETAERVTPERGPLERDAKKLPPEGEREDVMGEEELTRVMQDRERKQVLARATQRQESDKTVKSASTEKYMESVRVEIETPKELQEKGIVEQTLAREVVEREAEKLAPERECEPDGLKVSVPKVILEGGAWRGETERGSQDPKGQASSPTAEPEIEAGDFQGLASALTASESQSGGERGAPVSPTRQQRGHLNYKMPPAEKTSRVDPESLGAYLPLTQPEAAAPLPDPLISQSQKHPAPQPLFSLSPPLELPIPRTRQKRSQEAPETALSSEPAPFRAKPKVRPRGSSRMTPSPVSSIALEPHPTTPTDQPISPEPTSWATRRRTHTSSEMTPALVVLTAPELQSSTAEDQPVTPKNISQATQGRTNRSSVKMPVTPKRTSRGRTNRSSVKTPVTPKSISQVRTRRSSVKTPEPIVPTAPELQPSTPTDHPVTPKPTSRGRTHRPSIKTPEPIVPTAPELQPSTPTDHPVTPKPTSRGRTHRSSIKTPEPIVPTASELQHSTSTDQLVTHKPTSRGRTHRSSVKTPEPIVPTAPELQPSTSTDQPVVLEPTSQATWGRTRRASVKTYQPIEPTDPDLEPSTPTDHPIPPEPIPQANCSRRLRATRKHGFLAAPIVHKPSAPPEPDSRSSRTHRRGAVRAAESPRTPPEPAFAQLPEASTRAPQIQKVEAAGRHRSTPEPQATASQNHKRPLGTVDSPPLQKRLRRGNVPQKTATLKEENVVMPRPGKRKRDQAEEEPKGMPGRSLRWTKPNHKSTAPKVLFTGVVDARGERAVLALGGSLASSVAEASYLVTDRIRRTVKFLCALGRGIPILSLDWLHQSRRAGRFLPPDDYVVTDPEQEKNFGFSLRDALSRARERRLLEGYEIHVTPGVQPPPAQMEEIISCCGGTVLPSMPHSYKPQRVVITCSQDVPRCSIPSRVGVPILSPEFLLTGVLKQEATPEAFVLSTLEMSTT